MIGESSLKKGNKRLDEVVYDFIVNQIETGELLEREHITEQYVANTLNISRTPVRKAFNQLVEEEYLEDIVNVGVRVKASEITPTDFKERLDLFERLINFYLFDLEKKEIDFDIESLKPKFEQLKNSIESKTEEFVANEVGYWEEVLKYNTNKYSGKILLMSLRDCLGMDGKIGQIVKSSRSIIIKHLEQLMLHLGDNNYSHARREIRILLNQLKLNVIEMS